MSRFALYLSGRLVGAALTLMVGMVLIIVLMRLAPGDPALAALDEGATPEAVAAYRVKHHLNEPVWSQILYSMRNMAQGDFGESLTVADGDAVLPMVIRRMPNTAFIGGYALIIAVFVSLIVGTIATLRRGKIEDTAVTTSAVLGISMPDFWIGYLLILVFALGLGWFPAYGFKPVQESITQAIYFSTLPAMAIAAPMAASFSRFLRATLLETVGKDYVVSGRSLGFSEKFLFIHFVLRNSLIPYVTKVGMQVPYLLG